MRQKIKNEVSALCFIIMIVAVFLLIQKVFTNTRIESADRIFDGFELLGVDDIDVLVLGPSSASYGISPMTIYQETGINTYSLSMPGQPLASSYYLLKYAYGQGRHIPMVIFDVSYAFADTFANGAWRYALDNMKWCPVKLEYAKEYAAQSNTDDLMSVIFPIIEYHDRYGELSQADFDMSSNGFYYTAGQKFSTYVVPSTISHDDVNKEIECLLLENAGFTITKADGVETRTEISEPLYTVHLPEENIRQMERIKQLCDEHGTKCVFIKIPGVAMQTQYSDISWSKDRYAIFKEFADSIGVDYYDLIYDYDPGLDFSLDTVDRGLHLNANGAKKVSSFIAENIIAPSFPNGRSVPCEKYDAALALYNDAMVVADIEMERDFEAYLDKVTALPDKYLVLCAVKGEFVNGLSEAEKRALEDHGFSLTPKAYWGNSYVAAFKCGENPQPLYEELSNRAIDHYISIDGFDIWLKSAGYYCGDHVAIYVNGVEYAVNSTGISFVVYDKENQLAVDTVSFNTDITEHPAYHNVQFERYQDKVLFSQHIE